MAGELWLGSQPAKGITMAKEETRPGRSTNPAGSEFFNTLQEMRRDWMARATAEIELSLKLSKKLEAANSVPDALAAYQEWLNEEMGARAEDARLLMSNGQKFTDATSRFLSSGWTNVGMTTERLGDTGSKGATSNGNGCSEREYCLHRKILFLRGARRA